MLASKQTSPQTKKVASNKSSSGASLGAQSGLSEHKSIAQRVMDVTLLDQTNKQDQQLSNDVERPTNRPEKLDSLIEITNTTSARPILKQSTGFAEQNTTSEQNNLINQEDKNTSNEANGVANMNDNLNNNNETSKQDTLAQATSQLHSPNQTASIESAGESTNSILVQTVSSTMNHSRVCEPQLANKTNTNNINNFSDQVTMATCQPISIKHSVINGIKPASKEDINLTRSSGRISLETRVPHPSRHNGFHSEEEGVGYLNLGAHQDLNNRAACSSLDNTTKPILLAAAREQRSALNQSRATASSQQQLPTRISPSQQMQLQLHHQPVSSRQPISITGHEYEGMDGSDYDEYDTRYDNVLVEKRIRQNEKQLLEIERGQQQQQQHVGPTESIENLYDYTNEGSLNVVESRGDTQNNECSLSPKLTASPKAKSAPATPCNITPTAFHQHNPNRLGSPRGATIGGQVSNGSNDACRILQLNKKQLAQTAPTNPLSNLQDLDELVKRGERSLESKDFSMAVFAFTRCIDLALEQQNMAYLKSCQVYSKRAEAHFELNKYNLAIEDSIAARELNPKLTRAYYLEGRAKLLNGEPVNSLPVFAYGLAQEPTNVDLFEALIDATLKSSYKQDFEPKLQELRQMNLDRKPFLVVSMLGQEILAKGEHMKHAAVILESALKLEPTATTTSENKKFKSSVLSTVALAFCQLKDHEKAVAYMKKELQVESELGDVAAQCRVLSNLGFIYYKLRKFDKSLEAHRKQLNLAMKSNLYQQASLALNAIGHVHVARNDFHDALTSHTRCLDILSQLADNEFSQFKELLSIGHVCSMVNDLKMAEERYKEAKQLLDTCQCKLTREEYLIGCIMHRFNLAHIALKRQKFRDALGLYDEVIHISKDLSESNSKLFLLYQMRACNGMGHTLRLFKRFSEARGWFERQLKLAISIRNLEGHSEALCNLGMICQHFKENQQARRYFEENLRLVDKHPLLRAYALSYMGSMHFLLGHYNEAQAHYESSLSIFKDLNYCSAERKTIELNMAFVQERVGVPDLSYVNTSKDQQQQQHQAIRSPTHKKVMTAS